MKDHYNFLDYLNDCFHSLMDNPFSEILISTIFGIIIAIIITKLIKL